MAFRRFVAVLDVLGMKSWLENAGPSQIAEKLDAAFVACEQSSVGRLRDGTTFGPVIGVTHFSDSLLAWAPDDSWPSFGALCLATKMIIAVAIYQGVPLRGSISVGETVCRPRELRFVGQAIADAYLWSEKDPQRRYKSVGVDITPSTVKSLQGQVQTIPPHWRAGWMGIVASVIAGPDGDSDLLTWFNGLLFVNHWAHGIFTAHDPRELFMRRNLPVESNSADAVARKLEEMMEFYGLARTRQTQRSIENTGQLETFEDQEARLQDLALLHEIRIQRER